MSPAAPILRRRELTPSPQKVKSSILSFGKLNIWKGGSFTGIFIVITFSWPAVAVTTFDQDGILPWLNYIWKSLNHLSSALPVGASTMLGPRGYRLVFAVSITFIHANATAEKF